MNGRKENYSNMKKRSLLHIEFIRIIAAFFVIFNHTGDQGFFIYSTYDLGGINYWIALAISIFCKVSVPLFFMISGALLLEKEYSLKMIWFNKIAKMILVLIVVSIFYYIRSYLIGSSSELSLKMFIVKLYNGSISLSFWYLYAYLAMLVSIPFLKGIVKNLSNTHFLYLIGIYFLYISLIPCIEFLVWKGEVSINPNARVDWVLSNIVLYPIVGYYIEHKIDINKIQRKQIIAIWGTCLLGWAASCYMTYYRQKITGLLPEVDSQMFHNAFILFICAAVYITMKQICSRVPIPKIPGRLITSMGACTFGIYLIHITILRSRFISGLWNIFEHQLHMSRMIMPFVISFIVFCIGYMITFVLKKIPVIKRFI